MLLSVSVRDKSFGDSILYRDLQFDVEDGEKIGLIGRNGCGKSTLLGMITGEDNDFDGAISIKRGIVVITSRQEQHGYDDTKALDYIVADLPEFSKLSHIIATHPEKMGDKPHLIQEYSDALERFGDLDYYNVEDSLKQAFDTYQLDRSLLEKPLGSLSGGQKRLLELIKVQRAKAHLALIDEPTNHMDYVAKAAFVDWLKSAPEAVVVVTHDRDVLQAVDKIIEIRDKQADICKGNYDTYIRQNKMRISNEMSDYSVTQRSVENLKDDIIRFKRLKEKARDPGTIQRFKSQQLKAEKELVALQSVEKPTFWIDKDSVATMKGSTADMYEQHKARTIRIKTKHVVSKSSRLLVEATKLSLGYETPLFEEVSFQLREGERLRLHGRNGAGKTTLANAIIAKARSTSMPTKPFAGHLAVDAALPIGIYHQEIDPSYLQMTLGNAIESVLRAKNLPVSEQKVKEYLSDYLFDPATDGEKPLSLLSGGQKARFQLIDLLAGNPPLLLLDEPTNHLDLPSIEELETALQKYYGAIIYVSHDSYFAKSIGGETVTIGIDNNTKI